MNNEIKEHMQNCIDREESCLLNSDNTKILLDYITDLQEENKHLDEVNCKLRKGGEALKDTNKLLLKQKGQLQKDLDMLDNRIDNAIEYIEKEKSKDEEDNFIDLYLDKYESDLLEILKGETNDK